MSRFNDKESSLNINHVKSLLLIYIKSFSALIGIKRNKMRMCSGVIWAVEIDIDPNVEMISFRSSCAADDLQMNVVIMICLLRLLFQRGWSQLCQLVLWKSNYDIYSWKVRAVRWARAASLHPANQTQVVRTCESITYIYIVDLFGGRVVSYPKWNWDRM